MLVREGCARGARPKINRNERAEEVRGSCGHLVIYEAKLPLDNLHLAWTCSREKGKKEEYMEERKRRRRRLRRGSSLVRATVVPGEIRVPKEEEGS